MTVNPDDRLRFEVLRRCGDDPHGDIDLGPDLALSTPLETLSSVILGDLVGLCRHAVRFVRKPADEGSLFDDRCLAAIFDVALSDRWPLGPMFPEHHRAALLPWEDASQEQRRAALSWCPGQEFNREFSAGNMYWRAYRRTYGLNPFGEDDEADPAPHETGRDEDLPFTRFTFLAPRPFPYHPDSRREARAWFRRSAAELLQLTADATYATREHLESEPRVHDLSPVHLPYRRHHPRAASTEKVMLSPLALPAELPAADTPAPQQPGPAPESWGDRPGFRTGSPQRT